MVTIGSVSRQPSEHHVALVHHRVLLDVVQQRLRRLLGSATHADGGARTARQAARRSLRRRRRGLPPAPTEARRARVLTSRHLPRSWCFRAAGNKPRRHIRGSVSNIENFKAWYLDVLDSLYPRRDAGIAVLMISLPLLERYLRRKHGFRPDDPMADPAMDGLRGFFPALTSVVQARAFWNVYRNGLLHQATVSTSTRGGAALPAGWLTDDIAEPVRVERDGSFTVHPVLFSQVVVDAISAGFSTFEVVAPVLPQVVRRDPVTIPSSYLGTGSGRP